MCKFYALYCIKVSLKRDKSPDTIPKSESIDRENNIISFRRVGLIFEFVNGQQTLVSWFFILGGKVNILRLHAFLNIPLKINHKRFYPFRIKGIDVNTFF